MSNHDKDAGEVAYESHLENLRDTFAGQALNGILSDGDWFRRLYGANDPETGQEWAQEAAMHAYRVADAMMLARLREPVS